MPELAPVPRNLGLRLAVALWAAGMIGVIAFAVFALPRLLPFIPLPPGERELPLPAGLISVASAAQGAFLLALAAWAGAALAPAVGLRAPAFRAAVARESVARALRPQLVPGIVGGVAGGAVLVLFSRVAPPALAAVQKHFDVPLPVRVLYGGVTEEILLRWGFMTLLAWVAWRLLQRGSGEPRAATVWLAIAGSALVFGMGHLPVASLLVGGLTPVVVATIVGANAAFGVVAGYLYWRYGLESAMLAHAFAHGAGYLGSRLLTHGG